MVIFMILLIIVVLIFLGANIVREHSAKNIMKITDIFKNLINLIGSSIGIIMITIGSVMLINAFLKVYVFGIEKGEYYGGRMYDCDFINAQMEPLMDPYTQNEQNQIQNLTDQERQEKYDACVIMREVEVREEFKNSTMHSMINGLALILVGSPLLWYYSRRMKKEHL